ncbi:MAG TPA: STAS domain-containing protein [Candidatus Baltobacteraceae bacterium]|nr:STAS domain-containing protein [Candidatus Baltobacteraceae bacterium]
MEPLRSGAVTVSLHGDIDVSSARALKRLLSEAEDADAAVIDLSDVTYAGTTLFNALIALHKNMRRHGGEACIRIVGSSAQMRRLLTITCLDNLFDVA